MTTIALSTSMPTPSASPPSVIMLRLKLEKYMSTNVTMTENGIATPIMNGLFIDLRKINNTIIARIAPPINACDTLPTASSIYSP